MTAPDPYPSGLDPAHIVAVCAQATGRRGLAIGMTGGICVCLPSRRAARGARAALTRVGYQVSPALRGRGRDLVVSGWSAAGLESRLAAMRAVLHQLADNPSGTAVAVIDRFRALPVQPAPPSAGEEIVRAAGSRLRAWVHTSSGIQSPCDPRVVPGDVSVALRLRAAWALEQLIGDLAERRLRVAGNALALFSSLRQELGDDIARDRAIRWAGVTFHVSGTAAQESAPLIQGAAVGTAAAGQTPVLGRSPGTRPARRPPVTPARGVVREFPVPVTALDPAWRLARPPVPLPTRQPLHTGRPRLRP
jgi:hypothetical protein